MDELVKSKQYWASVSGGKDSLFMLRLILQNPHLYPLHGVVHFELEIDFPFVKDIINVVENICNKNKIPFLRVKPSEKWINLYEKNGYPSKVRRWCNGKYKLDCLNQLKLMLRNSGYDLYTYVGICYDEYNRIKPIKNKKIYPLVDFKIDEYKILRWAKKQPIFNHYYEHCERLGCMCCPLSSNNDLLYCAKYYPNEFMYFMKKARKTELRKNISVWSGNRKYDTLYKINKIYQEIGSKRS